MAKNINRVPKRQWRRWSEAARRAFNGIYGLMKTQDFYKHPEAPKLKREHWKTTRWNAAWCAAQVTDGKW